MEAWKRRTVCNKCLTCFQVIENVRAKVSAYEDRIGDFLDDAATKLRLFIGHTIRCKVQNTVIDEAK